MNTDELNSIINAIEQDNQTGWEQTRFITYITAVSNGAKLNSPTDIIRFSWETAPIETKETKEDLEETQRRLLSVLNRI